MKGSISFETVPFGFLDNGHLKLKPLVVSRPPRLIKIVLFQNFVSFSANKLVCFETLSKCDLAVPGNHPGFVISPSKYYSKLIPNSSKYKKNTLKFQIFNKKLCTLLITI